VLGGYLNYIVGTIDSILGMSIWNKKQGLIFKIKKTIKVGLKAEFENQRWNHPPPPIPLGFSFRIKPIKTKTKPKF
jgi:hypothetical protein